MNLVKDHKETIKNQFYREDFQRASPRHHRNFVFVFHSMLPVPKQPSAAEVTQLPSLMFPLFAVSGGAPQHQPVDMITR